MVGNQKDFKMTIFRAPLKQLYILIITGLFIAACSKTSTGASRDVRATFTMQLSSNNTLASKTQSNNKINDGTSIVFSDLSGTIFRITEARANIRHIQFNLSEEGIAEDPINQISIEGPFIINLISGETTPYIGDLPLDPGTYKRIDVRLDDTK